MQQNLISYREATKDDVEQMLFSRMGDRESGPGDYRMTAYFAGQHHPQKALLPRTGYIALRSENVVGYIAGHLTRRFECDGEVQYLYVVPELRRRGVAARLLRLMAEWSDSHDALRVCVNADVDSAAAVPFYVSQGAVALSKHWYVWDDIRVVLRELPTHS